MMTWTRMAAPLAVAATLAMSTGSQAQVPPCNPFPLSWPFCVVGAAAAIATAPFRAVAYPYYYPPPPPRWYYRRYYRYYYPPPYYRPY